MKIQDGNDSSVEKKKKTATKKKRNTESLADIAYKRLENMIITLELKPGSLWSENELSELLEIGRMPVREAIKSLAAAHLINILPRRGVMITEFKVEEFFLQTEVRRLLERLIASRAARLSTPEEREKFLQLADAYEKVTIEGNEMEAIKIDNEFNEHIGKCARNPYAYSAVAPLHALARRLYYMQYKVDSKLTREINHAHCDLMRAVASGDEKLAIEKSDYLLDCVVKLNRMKIDMYVYE